MAGPMDGVRIIDLSQVISGPYSTAQLADQGADVIKVEPTGQGDKMRTFPSFSVNRLSALFATTNRGKRSLSIDLDHDRGVAIVRRLCAEADVFLDNFRPGVVERMGLDPAELRAANPRLITVSISGYGLEGPMSGRPVYDPVLQAITGHVALQVNPDIPFPDLIRHAVVDKATSAYTAQAITAALFHRERTGEAQHIDLAMVDASLNFFWPDGMMAHTMLSDDVLPGATLAELYRLTNCSDGQLIYFAGTDEHRRGLFIAVGHPEWWEDERFNGRDVLVNADNLRMLGELLVEAFAVMSVDEAYDALVDNGVPCGMVTALDEVHEQAQVVANHSLVEVDHPVGGRIRQARPAARFSATPSEPTYLTPMCGQHTDEVLAEAGLTADEVAELRADGVVQ